MNFGTYNVTLLSVIQAFKHKGLERFFKTGSMAGIQPAHVNRLKLILLRLNHARTPRDMNLPGLKLHGLEGHKAGYYSVWVNGNWRIVFRFDGEHVTGVDYVDYH